MVGDTETFFQLRHVPGCRGATAYAPQTAPRSRMTIMLWVVLLDDGWGYEHVFRTGNIFRLGIRPCFRHLRVAFVGRMQYAPTRVTCRTSKYEYVFRTGKALRIKIRTCFPNQIHVIHRNTNTFSEQGTRYPSKCGRVFRIR